MNRNSATIRLAVAGAAVVALAGLTACSTKPISKAGSTDQRAQTIVLHMPDGSDPDGLYLAQDIAKRSHGALKVTIDSKTYASQSPANEARLTADIRAGQVAATILGQLPGYGAVGLGLIAGEPRQILSVRPLFAAPQFAGQKIRIVDNPQTAALVTALGARPVQRLASNQVNSPLRTGSVTAVETSPFSVWENGYQTAAPYLTSYGVFPKFETLVASKHAWAALPPADQAAIRHAVVDTRANSGQLASREALELTRLCQQGVVLDQPTAAQLGVLARDAATAAPAGAAAAAVDRQIKALPGTGVQPYTTGVPAGCRVAGDEASAAAIHQVLTPAFGHQGGGKIPPGTYVTTDTVADWQAGGQYGDDWNKAITYTTVIRADGTLRETQAPDYPDQGPLSGHYVVKGDEVTFSWSQPTANWSATEKVRWSYFDGQLTFAIVDVADTSSRVIYTAHPWRKTG
jgi:hypothetical protein